MIILNMKKLRRTHKPHLQVLQKLALEAAERMRKRGCKLIYEHVPRDKNKLADEIANQAADTEQRDTGIAPAPPEPPRASWAGYFDGAARDNGRGVAGAGALMLVDGVKRFQFLKPLPRAPPTTSPNGRRR